jgi:hypothetical protein
MEKKKEGYKGSTGEGFISYMTIFFLVLGDREAAEVTLRGLYFGKG